MIQLKNITKYYNKVKVLDNINLKFSLKGITAILGPSGSGKSTLLNIIAGNEIPNEGKVLLGNNNLLKINMDYYHNHVLSYIYQNYNLINNLNVYDNLIFGLKLTNQKIDKEKIARILTNLKINGLANKKIWQLSGGEKQRVAIARSIINDSMIILADEPTGALDTLNSINIMNILKDLAKDKLIIMVTHNEQLATKYANRIIKINDGHIIYDSNEIINENNINFKIKKTKLKLSQLIKISFNNIKNKLNRSFLTAIAFSIGLFTLALVLSINNGFKNNLKTIEKNSLYNYPLIISKITYNLNQSLTTNQKYNKNKININKNEYIIRNNINEQMLSEINKLNPKLLDGITYYRDIDNDFKNISYIIPNKGYFKILYGRLNQNKNEVLLLLDQNNAINENVADYLNIKSLNYEDAINKKIIISNKELIITGIVNSNNNYFSSLNGVLYSNDLFTEEITDIYLFAKDYHSKDEIKRVLNEYNVVDNAKSVIDLTSSLIKSITYILIIFCFISLLVSIIMISIISYINVLERYNEIGIMKSLGTRKKDIKRLFIIENNIIGLFSAIISAGFTFLLSKIINKYIASKIEITNLINLNYQIVIAIILLSLLLTYIASLIPAIKASNKKIIDILHNS